MPPESLLPGPGAAGGRGGPPPPAGDLPQLHRGGDPGRHRPRAGAPGGPGGAAHLRGAAPCHRRPGGERHLPSQGGREGRGRWPGLLSGQRLPLPVPDQKIRSTEESSYVSGILQAAGPAALRHRGHRRGHRHDAPGQRGPGALERAPAGPHPDLRHHLRPGLHPGGDHGHSHRRPLRRADRGRDLHQHHPVRRLHGRTAGPGLAP